MGNNLPCYDAVFLIARPIQLVIAEIVKTQLNYSCTCLIIIDDFSNAKMVYKNVKRQNLWTKTVFVKSRSEAFKRLSKDINFLHLFVHSDAGLRHHFKIIALKFRKPRFRVVVFEEGVGTYRVDLVRSLFKRVLVAALGAGTNFGQSFFTDSIYLFEPERYKRNLGRRRKAKTQQILISYQEFIEDNIDRLNTYFKTPNIARSHEGLLCSIYISSWDIDYKFIETLTAKRTVNEAICVKPHPQIKNVPKIDNVDYVIPNRLPVELFFAQITTQYQEVVVYHHNSTCAHYFKAKNLNFVTI